MRTKTFSGQTCFIPDPGDVNYPDYTSDTIELLVDRALARTGSKINDLTSMTANPAVAGLHRLAHVDKISWRNYANSADLSLGPDAANDNLLWDGVRILKDGDAIEPLTVFTTANLPKIKSDGTYEDSSIAASDVSKIIIGNNLYIAGQTYNSVPLTFTVDAKYGVITIRRGVVRYWEVGASYFIDIIISIGFTNGDTAGTLTVPGVTFKNVADYRQIGCAHGQPGLAAGFCYAVPNTSGIYFDCGSANELYLSGSFELNAKPTWIA